MTEDITIEILKNYLELHNLKKLGFNETILLKINSVPDGFYIMNYYTMSDYTETLYQIEKFNSKYDIVLRDIKISQTMCSYRITLIFVKFMDMIKFDRKFKIKF